VLVDSFRFVVLLEPVAVPGRLWKRNVVFVKLYIFTVLSSVGTSDDSSLFVVELNHYVPEGADGSPSIPVNRHRDEECVFGVWLAVAG